MLTDAPYGGDGLVLNSRAGVIAGVGAGLAMVLVVMALAPLSGTGWRDASSSVGAGAVPWASGSTELAVAGTVAHLIIAALLGALHASCQQRAPLRGLVAVGLFYGTVVAWIVPGRLLGWALDPALRQWVRSWAWLAACLIYGTLLATTAWMATRRAPAPQAVPLD